MASAAMAESGGGEEGGEDQREGVKDTLQTPEPSAGVEELSRMLATARERLRASLHTQSWLEESVEKERQRASAEAKNAQQLEYQLDNFRADCAIAGSKLYDGSIDLLRGQKLSECMQQLEQARDAKQQAEQVQQELQALLDEERKRRESSESAAREELHSLAVEASQCRLSAQARKREASEEAANARSAQEEAASARADASAAHEKAERERSAREHAEQAKSEAEAETERAQAAEQQAEARREEAELQAAEAAKHSEWLESRISELTSSDWHRANERHAHELQQLRSTLEQEKLRLQSELSAERQRRHELERELDHAKQELNELEQRDSTLRNATSPVSVQSMVADADKAQAAEETSHADADADVDVNPGSGQRHIELVERAVETLELSSNVAIVQHRDAAVHAATAEEESNSSTSSNAGLLTVANNEIAHLKDVNERLTNDVQTMRERLKAQVEHAQTQLREKADEIEQLKQSNEALQTELKKADEEREVEAMAAALDASAAAQSAAEKRISELQQSMASANAPSQQKPDAVAITSTQDAEVQTPKALLDEIIAQERVSATVDMQKVNPLPSTAAADANGASLHPVPSDSPYQIDGPGEGRWERRRRRKQQSNTSRRSPRESLEAASVHAAPNGRAANGDMEDDMVRMSLEDESYENSRITNAAAMRPQTDGSAVHNTDGAGNQRDDDEEEEKGRRKRLSMYEDATTPPRSLLVASAARASTDAEQNGASGNTARRRRTKTTTAPAAAAADTPLRELAASTGSNQSAKDGVMSSLRASRELRQAAMEQAEKAKDMAQSASQQHFRSPSRSMSNCSSMSNSNSSARKHTDRAT